MSYMLDAACLCNTGKVRKNNEDNFFFDNRCLEVNNTGLKHPVSMAKPLRRELCVAVFDGMGGENFGEYASSAAAECMQHMTRRLKDYLISERNFLSAACAKINDAVVAKQKEMCTERMGSTMVALYFSHNHVYVCNIGDSRAYRLRSGELLQLSVDHVERHKNPTNKKSPLTQHLGINPDDLLIEPYIAKGDLQQGDQYLICSDGLTDMLTNFEIDDILRSTITPEDCVQRLVNTALEKGGKDNITVIVCRII